MDTILPRSDLPENQAALPEIGQRIRSVKKKKYAFFCLAHLAALLSLSPPIIVSLFIMILYIVYCLVQIDYSLPAMHTV